MFNQLNTQKEMRIYPNQFIVRNILSFLDVGIPGTFLLLSNLRYHFHYRWADYYMMCSLVFVLLVSDKPQNSQLEARSLYLASFLFNSEIVVHSQPRLISFPKNYVKGWAQNVISVPYFLSLVFYSNYFSMKNDLHHLYIHDKPCYMELYVFCFVLNFPSLWL